MRKNTGQRRSSWRRIWSAAISRRQHLWRSLQRHGRGRSSRSRCCRSRPNSGMHRCDGRFSDVHGHESTRVCRAFQACLHAPIRRKCPGMHSLRRLWCLIPCTAGDCQVQQFHPASHSSAPMPRDTQPCNLIGVLDNSRTQTHVITSHATQKATAATIICRASTIHCN